MLLQSNPLSPTRRPPPEADASSALFLNAGRANGGFGLAPGEGDEVIQAFTTAGGSASFSADIAALFTRTGGDLGVGLMSVLLDGVVMDSYDFGDGSSGPITLRGELDFTTTLAAGDHHFAAGIPPIWPGRGVSSQYFDNVSLDVTAAVPAPSTWAMIFLDFAGVGFLGYRRKQDGGAINAA